MKRIEHSAVRGATAAIAAFVSMIAIAAVSAPRDSVIEAAGPALGGLIALFLPGVMAVIAVLLSRLAERRMPAPELSGFLVMLVLAAVTGATLTALNDLFARVGAFGFAVPERLGAAEIAGFALAAIALLIGLVTGGQAIQPKSELSGHDRRQFVWAAPVLIAEGAALAALTLARLVDWTAPGTVHAVLAGVFIAGLVAAAVFTAASWRTYDEAERAFSLRHGTLSAVIVFFLALAWAFAETAIGAPQLDAYTALLVLLAVSILALFAFPAELAALWAEPEEAEQA
ncbi:MAG: hypothetical protein ABL308_10015 [Oceanicaulis sp.]